MKKVRLGFVGCGTMGQRAHLDNYAVLPEAELVALADLRPRTRDLVAQRYGIPQTYDTHQDLLEDADVDAVVVIMGYAFHHAVVPDVLLAGKHCLTEKPICVKATTAADLAARAQGAGVVYQIGYMKRADLASRRMKELLAEWRESGKHGDLKLLRVSMPPGDWVFQMPPPLNAGDTPAPPFPPAETPPDWMSAEEQKQYNAFINYYIHQVNLIRFLLGEDYEVEYVDPRGVLLVARSESGVTVALEMAAYTLRDEWHEFYTACFERGKLSLSLTAPLARQHVGELQVYEHGETGARYRRPVFPPVWCMEEQARLFLAAVNGERPCLSPAVDAVKDLQVAEAVIRKQRENEVSSS